MKRITVLAALCVGVIVHSVLSVIWGTSGVYAYKYMEKEEKRLSEHLESLELIQHNLTAELESLRTDPQTMAIYAHELGYVKEGERLIKLADYNALGINALQRYKTGEILEMKRMECLPEWFCKVSGIISFVLILLIVRFKSGGEISDDSAVQ